MEVLSIPRQVYGQLAEILVNGKARRATKFLSEKLVVKATRKLFQGKVDRRSSSVDIVLTVGPPNYAEREFIKRCKTVGEPFPVKKIQIKWLKS